MNTNTASFIFVPTISEKKYVFFLKNNINFFCKINGIIGNKKFLYKKTRNTSIGASVSDSLNNEGGKMYRKIFVLSLGLFVIAGVLSAQTYENSPDAVKLIPEAIWAASTGGGLWQTEVQITSRSNGTEIHGTFYYGGGNARAVNYGVSLNQWQLFKAGNILSYMGTIDTSYDYYNKVGTLIIYSQDSSHNIQVNARTRHSSGYAKSFNGITNVTGQSLNSTLQYGAIMNLSNDSDRRSSMACFNFSDDDITVEFYVMNHNGNYIGLSFTKTFTGSDFQAFDPFAEAGLTGNYNNHFVYMAYRSGSGNLFVIGASANNTTNDPSAHTFLPWVE